MVNTISLHSKRLFIIESPKHTEREEDLNNLYINFYIKEIDDILYIINKQIFNIQHKLYEINQKGIKARAYIMDDKLTVVIKGSEAVKNITPSSKKNL